MLLLTCRVVLLQLLCVLAAATSQGERTWTLEATLLHDDPSHPPEPTLKESVHENLETLATLELTLHDLHLDESVVSSPGSPDAAAQRSQIISALHNKIGKVSEALGSLQGYLVHLKNDNSTIIVSEDSTSLQCNTTTHFPCGDGTCHPNEQKCDGIRDCDDGADELLCGLTRALCGSSQWSCLEGNQCISVFWRCDGDIDCKDGSDELECGSHRCAVNQFDCSNSSTNHQCIPRNWRCDGEDDCPNSTDERNCVRAQCSDAYFKCSSGDKCIHSFWRCDGSPDCFDSSDESNCHEIIASCTSKEFECASHNECVPKEKVCDGAGDCHDLSDEAVCPSTPSKRFPFVPKNTHEVPVEQKVTVVNSTTECKGRFLCATGNLCIPAEWHCDRDDDCPDSSDEVGCIEAVCKEGYFRCVSGDKCVHSRWRCDGDYDCFDKSDEFGCSDIHVECEGSDFKCTLHGECVPPSKVCDGVSDCQDSSDEARCPIHVIDTAILPSILGVAPNVSKNASELVSCGPFETQCVSGQCIASGWWCDGELDCIDESDEHFCPESICEKDQLTCAAEGKCFPLSFKCDGQRDCSDGSDEEGCPKRACMKSEFTCQDTGRCLPNQWWCDGQRDCLDGDDEVGCPKFQVKGCDLDRGQFPCRSDSKCLSSKRVCDGHRDCIDGSDEGGACEELCFANSCSDGCFRTPHGPQCTCPTNTTLDDRGVTCVGGLPSPFVLVGRRDALEAYSLDGSWNLTVYEGKSTHSGVIKVAYDPVEDEVYWSIVEMAGVYKRDLIKKNPPQFVFDTDENVVEAFAIDYLGRNMYIMDGMRQLLLACSLKDFVCATVLTNTTSSPRSLQLDLRNRKMFWTDWKAGIVESSDLDGFKRSVLASNLMWPNALAIDSVSQRVYWMEASTDSLESMKYDGTDRKLISSGTVQHVYAMDLWADNLYFTDWSTQTVYKCNPNACNDKTPVTDVLPGSPFGVKVVHIQLLEVSNPCKNQPCSHICLLSSTTGKGYRCSCPSHLTLQKDHHTCAVPKRF
ncbi:low-density lipoprotein receptor-related protein 2-like [Portunus trituberculatus]|uniref:low-density lipoprotein receptor-related protein 2-like n=1 Tax=Portunus trituberculatus TaxID=210409 RepID=UPI001E1CB2C2|nr:low-density lipoprotein receptor-related protein 2-like [Portunus trituberculatus]XP_045139061.1 low-density lipoprotein receptor-related protein 2-like [Portunus trituberculatus]XP_045139062.1 low-density lipoprotein receptor-related protein 2-like [Portunus trituberculatus]